MLYSKKRSKGFSIIELLIAIGFIAVIVAIGGTISSEFFLRRSVDNITYQIGSLLNLVKLQAVRQGLEYQITINYDDDEKMITLTNERGDSNKNSTIYQTTSSNRLSIPNDYILTLPRGRDVHSFNFNPNGTLGGASGSITIRPLSLASRTNKCGRIVISPFGRIRTVIGRWNFGSNNCRGIGDRQER
ncbi:MAG: pilus assembly FimT family protein [Thermodesulfobacteriota bacterium]